jgi:hypothetical protein
MKTLLAALCLFSAHPFLSAGELRDEIDSYEEAFHQALHTAPEIYLVCFYQVEKKPWAKEWERLEIKATIVEVIRGERKVGERIEFERVLDGKYGDISKLIGSLKYVQYYRKDQEGSPEFGKLDIDPQDPAALFRYSPEFSVIAAEHKPKAQQPGTGQPATRPVVEPAGSDKPQPEAGGRSR